MDKQILIDVAQKLVADDKGLLAMDESTPTCNKRFKAVGIATTEEARRAYREMIVTTPRLGECISGAILFEETIGQSAADGRPFLEILEAAGILAGVKLDAGAKALAGHAGEKVTEGLDGLRERIAVYAVRGLSFAKWRAVITIGQGLPSRACVDANAHALARYAALCQEGGLVPIVEPEVLMDGDHDLAACLAATEQTLDAVFAQLRLQGVLLEGMLLKPNMVVSGLACPRQATVDEVAEATLTCLRRHAPAAVPGIAFLSGGQTAELASARLDAMNLRAKTAPARYPWAVTFSYSRAIQQPALEIWRGEAANVVAAQRALYHRAACNKAARRGEYNAAMDAAAMENA